MSRMIRFDNHLFKSIREWWFMVVVDDLQTMSRASVYVLLEEIPVVFFNFVHIVRKKSNWKRNEKNLHHVCQISLFLWEINQPETRFWCIRGYEGKITGNLILVHWRILREIRVFKSISCRGGQTSLFMRVEGRYYVEGIIKRKYILD